MESFISKIQENPALAIALIIGIFILIALMKFLFRFAIIALVLFICGTVAYGIYTPEEIVQVGKEKVVSIIESEMAEADYTFNDDGTFVIKTTSLSISGSQKDENVTVSYKEHTLTLSLETVKQYIPEEKIDQYFNDLKTNAET